MPSLSSQVVGFTICFVLDLLFMHAVIVWCQQFPEKATVKITVIRVQTWRVRSEDISEDYRRHFSPKIKSHTACRLLLAGPHFISGAYLCRDSSLNNGHRAAGQSRGICHRRSERSGILSSPNLINKWNMSCVPNHTQSNTTAKHLLEQIGRERRVPANLTQGVNLVHVHVKSAWTRIVA